MREKRSILTLLITLLVACRLGAEEKFEMLQIGPNVYSNVTVLNKTRADLFITHAQGLANIKVRELDNDLRAKLGYELDPNQARSAKPALAQLEVDPRVAAMQEQIAADVEQQIREVAPNLLLGVGAGAALLYLFYCFCLHLICQKAGTPSFLVWIPLLQLFPMFRAARMPSVSVLGLFAPQFVFVGAAYFMMPEDFAPGSPRTMVLLGLGAVSVLVSLLVTIVWCVRICRYRNKNGLLALFLLFPLTSPLAFLYLAFSSVEAEPEVINPGYVTFS